MNTNFFSQVAAMELHGNLQINITKGSNGRMVVSMILDNQHCNDSAKKLIPPLVLNATCEELDNQFFETISKPMQQVSAVMVDMESFVKQIEQAKSQSTMSKQQAQQKDKEQESEDKKLQSMWTKVDQLEAEGKYRDAWTKIPDPSKYPEQGEKIRNRRLELSAKFEPDLFAALPASESSVLDSGLGIEPQESTDSADNKNLQTDYVNE
ncbi:MAG: PRTRC system protein E [Sphingobacterium sp.]|uniref:PRTRC system protein E n=1 Tax=Sphingobacterium sp. TaxID=341027 RepID=UPI00284A91BA|nr:PRTRC system protein E [Sphingobacterium sp.]MDR3008638.1 PRTRC system protein E [Sphingobacterium sp.]